MLARPAVALALLSCAWLCLCASTVATPASATLTSHVLATASQTSTPSASSVIGDLVAMNTSLVFLETALDKFDGSAYRSLRLAFQESNAAGSVAHATYDAIRSPAFSRHQSQAVNDTVQGVVPTVTDTLDAFVAKKSEFHAAHVDPFVLVSLQGFKMGANRLLDALAQKSLPPYNSAIADVKSFLDQAFSLAIANYTAAL